MKAEDGMEDAVGRRRLVVRELPDRREEGCEYDSEDLSGSLADMGGRSSSGTSFPHQEGLTAAAGAKSFSMVIPIDFGAD